MIRIEKLVLHRFSLSTLPPGTEEQKYTKIRLESLRALLALIKGVNAAELGGLSEEIRGIIRASSADSQPSVLEIVAKVQEAWFKIQLSKGTSS